MHTPLTNIPDMVSVDVGDLDKVPDVKGENHDEVLAAYATGAGPSYPIQLAVLNYTNAQGNGSNPTWVTQVTAPYQATAAYASTISDVISVAIGDFDGDGQNEIALATLGPNGSGQVNLTIFRYTNPGNGQTPTLMPVTNQTFTLKVGGATADFLPTISLVAGDFAGSGHGA